MMIFRGAALILIAGILTAAAPIQSQSDIQPNVAQQAEQRGTDDAPLVVRMVPTRKTDDQITQEQAERDDKSSADWWMVRLTGIIGLIGFLQLIVFGLQALRLKETIQKMDEVAAGQTADMKASIREATKSATAMEGIAASIAANVDTTTKMAANQREFWLKQMRAYVSVVIGIAVFQERGKSLKFEARPTILNTGSTPAKNLRFRCKASILPVPLPSDFKFPLPADMKGGATLAPHQTFMLSAIVDDYVDEIDVPDIKKAAGRALYVWGVVSYEDVIGDVRETQFCQIYTWLPNETIWGYYTQEHNDTT